MPVHRPLRLLVAMNLRRFRKTCSGVISDGEILIMLTLLSKHGDNKDKRGASRHSSPSWTECIISTWPMLRHCLQPAGSAAAVQWLHWLADVSPTAMISKECDRELKRILHISKQQKRLRNGFSATPSPFHRPLPDCAAAAGQRADAAPAPAWRWLISSSRSGCCSASAGSGGAVAVLTGLLAQVSCCPTRPIARC